jgi:hypothetical protein
LQLSQAHPHYFHQGSPRKSRKPSRFSQEIPETHRIAENNTQNLPRNPKNQKITSRIPKEIPEIHKTAGNH